MSNEYNDYNIIIVSSNFDKVTFVTIIFINILIFGKLESGI